AAADVRALLSVFTEHASPHHRLLARTGNERTDRAGCLYAWPGRLCVATALACGWRGDGTGHWLGVVGAGSHSFGQSVGGVADGGALWRSAGDAATVAIAVERSSATRVSGDALGQYQVGGDFRAVGAGAGHPIDSAQRAEQ